MVGDSLKGDKGSVEYCISRNLCNTYLDEIEERSTEVTQVHGAVRVGGVTVLPVPHYLED